MIPPRDRPPSEPLSAADLLSLVQTQSAQLAHAEQKLSELQYAHRQALSALQTAQAQLAEHQTATQALEQLRQQLNKIHGATRGKLTLLPFVVRALVLLLLLTLVVQAGGWHGQPWWRQSASAIWLERGAAQALPQMPAQWGRLLHGAV